MKVLLVILKAIRDLFWIGAGLLLGGGWAHNAPFIVLCVATFGMILLLDAGEALLVRLFSTKFFTENPLPYDDCQCEARAALWLACRTLAQQPLQGNKSTLEWYEEFLEHP